MTLAKRLRNWILSRSTKHRKSLRRRRPAWFRANRFEFLEARTLLAQVNWIGAAGTSDWFTASNWDLGVVPGPADDVAIDQAGAVVQIGSGDVTIHSLVLSQSLNLAGTSFTVTDTASLTGGSLTASAGVNHVEGVFSAAAGVSLSAWNAGT